MLSGCQLSLLLCTGLSLLIAPCIAIHQDENSSLSSSLNLSLDLCPVSRYRDPIHDNSLPYPQFYFPEHVISTSEQYFPCVDEPGRDLIPQRCLPNLCPVKSSFITASQQPMTWKPRVDALCQLNILNKMKRNYSKVVVNVIVFGGSMTFGQYLDGKCCLQRENKTFSCHHRMKNDIELDPSVHYCHWFGELTTWMRREYSNVHFAFYNMALSGTSSGGMAGEVATILIDMNVTLTGHDIIILDHSCNDAGGSGASVGLEPLVREIYHFSRDHHSHNSKSPSYPTIIVSEQFQRAPGGTSNDPYNPENGNDYRTTYRLVSEAYGLLYFSFSEVTWSEFVPATETSQMKDNPYLATIRTYELHSPWHVSLFIADIFAGFIKSITSQHCTEGITPSLLHQTSHPIIPLHPISKMGDWYEQFMCDISHSPLVFARSHSTFHPSNVTAYESTLTSGWEEYIDYHQQSGFIINSNSQPQNRTLVYPFDIEKIMNITAKVVFRIQYLKTYENAGWIEISICSIQKAQLDTLHGHRNVRTSIPRWHSISLDRQFFQLYCQQQKHPSEVVITYNPRANESNNDARKSRKVKIYMIEMCFQQTVSNEDAYYKIPLNETNKVKRKRNRKMLRR